MSTLTVTSLRENLFNIFDKIIASGVPEVIERKGKKLKIALVGKVNKFERLIPHNSIVGNPDKLINDKPYLWKETKNI